MFPRIILVAVLGLALVGSELFVGSRSGRSCGDTWDGSPPATTLATVVLTAFLAWSCLFQQQPLQDQEKKRQQDQADARSLKSFEPFPHLDD